MEHECSTHEDKKIRATYSTNHMRNQNKSRSRHVRFPALGADYVFPSCSHWFFVLFNFPVIGHSDSSFFFHLLM